MAGEPDEQLDLRKPPPGGGGKVDLSVVDHYSETWAAIARPFAWFVFGLVGVIVVLPFIVVLLRSPTSIDPLDKVLDWGKTVLAPIVGFGSAVVGYYFGTRTASTARDRATERTRR